MTNQNPEDTRLLSKLKELFTKTVKKMGSDKKIGSDSK